MSRKSSRRQLQVSGTPESPCELCKRCHSLISSPREWKNEQAVTYVFSLNLTPNSRVCRPCRDDVTRVVAYPFYVPRWEKGKDGKESSNCCVTGCSSTSVVVTTVASTVRGGLRAMVQFVFQQHFARLTTTLYMMTYNRTQNHVKCVVHD